MTDDLRLAKAGQALIQSAVESHVLAMQGDVAGSLKVLERVAQMTAFMIAEHKALLRSGSDPDSPLSGTTATEVPR